MPRDDVQARYNTDPAFRGVVDMLHALIRNVQLSPAEVRQAAMLASIRYEMFDVRHRWGLAGLTPGQVVEVQAAAADAAMDKLYEIHDGPR